MNRKLLALAIGAALTLPVAAQAAPTVYGQLNMSVDRVESEFGPFTAEETQVNSNASRLGVKGEESLGNGLSAVYKAEWGVAGDVYGVSDLVGRDRFLGLKSDTFGTIKLGAYDSPLKDSQGSVDQFDDMSYGDMGNFMSGENRLDNLIGYTSPKIADMVTINAAVQSGEEYALGPFVVDDDAVSVAVALETGGVYVAAAMDHNLVDFGVDSLVQSLFMSGFIPAYNGPEANARDNMRVTGIYSTDSFQFGAMFQTGEFSDDTATGFQMDEEALLVSGAVKLDKNTVKAQVIMANLDFGAGAEIDTTVFQVGVDHNFTQMTKAFVQTSMTDIDDGSGIDNTTDVWTLGMQTKF